MTDTHAIVWLDHQHCRVICFSGEESTLNEVRSENGTGRIHNKSGAPGSGHAADDHKFFDEIVHQVGAVPKVIVAGPGTAKNAFVSYVQKRHRHFAERVASVETVDHPTDGELLAHARRSFKAVDQLGLL